ncbi:hypothetical protein LCGC14_2870160, partial [marine sediment metagenome]
IFPLEEHDRSASFLPWAHSFGQTVELHTLTYFGASTGLTSAKTLIRDMPEIKPTILVSVPTVFNKVYDGLKKRMEAEVAYYDLIYTGKLQNYPQCHELTQHVLDAEARYTRGGSFRLDKSAKVGVYIDGAVADSQACLGVMELQSEFVRPNLPRRKKKLKSPYKAAYG